MIQVVLLPTRATRLEYSESPVPPVDGGVSFHDLHDSTRNASEAGTLVGSYCVSSMPSANPLYPCPRPYPPHPHPGP